MEPMHSSMSMEDLKARHLAAQRRSANLPLNLPREENIFTSHYDVPYRCDQCKTNCTCPDQVCSHDKQCSQVSGNDSELEGVAAFHQHKGSSSPSSSPSSLRGSVQKDPLLVYDLPGTASLTDQLAITNKQMKFFEEELQRLGE